MVGRSQPIFRTDVLVVRVGSNFRMMRGVIVAKDTLIISKVGVCAVNPDRIAQFCADHFVDAEKRAIPECYPAADQPVVVIRCQEGDRFFDFTDLRVLT